MKQLSFEQMESFSGGRNDLDCGLAMAGFAASLAGFITTSGVGPPAWIGMGGLVLSSWSFIRSFRA